VRFELVSNDSTVTVVSKCFLQLRLAEGLHLFGSSPPAENHGNIVRRKVQEDVLLF
jgi:hypothetical protein